MWHVGILVTWPGIEPVLPALEVWGLNHWTFREAQKECFLKKKKKNPRISWVEKLYMTWRLIESSRTLLFESRERSIFQPPMPQLCILRRIMKIRWNNGFTLPGLTRRHCVNLVHLISELCPTHGCFSYLAKNTLSVKKHGQINPYGQGNSKFFITTLKWENPLASICMCIKFQFDSYI